MRIGEVVLFIRDLIQPLCARMALAAGTRHQIETALETLWRLLEPPADRRAQFRFVYREPFNDALALLELYALSSGSYVDSLPPVAGLRAKGFVVGRRSAAGGAPPQTAAALIRSR